MSNFVPLIISIFSLLISATTAWLTLMRRGSVRMTQPTIIFLGPDTPSSPNEVKQPKVYIRALLFSTSKRGRIIENMHVALQRNETHQNFNIWVYGDRQKLERGSGLFIGETGLVANHHFLMHQDGNIFRFIEGHYKLDVFAHLLGDKKPIKLFSQTLDISNDAAESIRAKDAGLYFDWGPDSLRYLPHIEKQPIF